MYRMVREYPVRERHENVLGPNPHEAGGVRWRKIATRGSTPRRASSAISIRRTKKPSRCPRGSSSSCASASRRSSFTSRTRGPSPERRVKLLMGQGDWANADLKSPVIGRLTCSSTHRLPAGQQPCPVARQTRLTVDRELASANVDRAAFLTGSGMAIFTFLLFFLYPRFSSGEINPILFQVTLTVIVLTIFSFSFSGLYYYQIRVLKMTSAQERASMRNGNLLWVLGTLFAGSEPALILFTVGLVAVALVALSLWLLYIYIIASQFRAASSH